MTARTSRTIRKLSIAPMLDYTDRHFRYVMRQFSKETLLYTEMVTTGALIYGDAPHHLDFDAREKPVALQLGGDNPQALAQCAQLAEKWGYDEINLNVGCPSGRVQRGNFGACLMADAPLVGRCIAAMQKTVSLPITVKHRIGIDEQKSYAELKRFVEIVADHGCNDFIVHARIALLGGLSPKQNREIPPLRYEDVYQLKKDFPALTIEINGGIDNFFSAEEHLDHVDSVMIGRAAIDTPFLFAAADHCFFGVKEWGPTRGDIIEAILPYLDAHVKGGEKAHYVIRHLLGLFARKPGNKRWRRGLTEDVGRSNDPVKAIKMLRDQMDPNLLSVRPAKNI